MDVDCQRTVQAPSYAHPWHCQRMCTHTYTTHTHDVQRQHCQSDQSVQADFVVMVVSAYAREFEKCMKGEGPSSLFELALMAKCGASPIPLFS
jgi:hypothetical protein